MHRRGELAAKQQRICIWQCAYCSTAMLLTSRVARIYDGGMLTDALRHAPPPEQTPPSLAALFCFQPLALDRILFSLNRTWHVNGRTTAYACIVA